MATSSCTLETLLVGLQVLRASTSAAAKAMDSVGGSQGKKSTMALKS